MIKSADEAIKIARDYLAPFARREPQLAKIVNGVWYVKIDVGVLESKVIEVEIDAETGEIRR